MHSEPDAMDVAIITSLIAGGMDPAAAKDKVLNGGGDTAPIQEQAAVPEKDVEPPVIPQKSKDFSDDQVALFEELKNIDENNIYDVNIQIPAYLYDWIIRKTLQEAHSRNNPRFLVEDFFILQIKEQRMLDPTKGGAVTGGSSGPKDTYNPITEAWG